MKTLINKLGTVIDHGASKLHRNATYYYERATQTRVRLGVAGFSGAGKTSLLTALIYHLKHNTDQLGGLSAALEKRIVRVTLHDQLLRDENLQPFPYAEHLAELTGTNPAFPASTTSVSAVDLTIDYLNHRGKARKIMVEITDFPGEWLVDVSMLKMSFETWSNWQAKLWQKHAPIELLDSIQKQARDATAPPDLTPIARWLKQCKADSTSLLIQPGRATTEGDYDFDLFTPVWADSSPYYRTLMEQRYQHYLKHYVTPFHNNHLANLDRQLLMIDLQRTLNRGPEYARELSEALSLTLHTVEMGEKGLFDFIRPKVNKVMFVASKMDEFLPEDHEPARRLVQKIAADAIAQSRVHGIDFCCEAVAGIRTTQYCRVDNEAYMSATPYDSQRSVMFQNPTPPLSLHDSEQWDAYEQWEPRKFRPIHQHNGMEHIRIDTVAEQLLGDYLK